MIRKLVTSMLLCIPLLCTAAEKININTADHETLTSVTGIGPSLANSIISYREKNGSFASVADLTKIRGIGNAFITANKDNLTIETESTP